MTASITIAARVRQLVEAGQFARDGDAVVPSPCVSVCRMTPDRSRCEGCFRSIEEIRAWSRSDAQQRRAIWTALLERAGLPVPQELQA
ncbi:DUF1289 domain-containing protein [Melaminivora alkalimesophila]|uniref:Fe-S protein YdhL (DUF1289 family) n=1 Tax=Melaminivora alkalimesophila TaxID=1165852 RepID=A0A317RGP4_9BURK|nr:DUF1289 domain-containing protein [Melaminivora alkalimesophila]PWW47978.1 hypothetical protein DFR36_102359 [Melaminivora alkalimesophila]